MTNAQRWLDQQPPDLFDAIVLLRDALLDYIRADEAFTRELLDEGQITPEQALAPDHHLDRCRAVLKALEEMEVNPSLNGWIDMRRQ